MKLRLVVSLVFALMATSACGSTHDAPASDPATPPAEAPVVPEAPKVEPAPSEPAPAEAVPGEVAPEPKAEGPTPPAPKDATPPKTEPAPKAEKPADTKTAGGGACKVDADCVKASCCHASSCVAKSEAPDCGRQFCTQECRPNTLDCGGQCACQAGKCAAVFGGKSSTM